MGIFFNKYGHVRILVLQAENEQDMSEWISSIRTASQQALNSDNAPRYTQQSPNLRKVRGSSLRYIFIYP